MADTSGTDASAKPKKQLILNGFVEIKELSSTNPIGSGHQSPGLWRHPQDESFRFNDVAYWTDLARRLEKAKFHGIFIADVLGGYDVYNNSLDAAIRSAAQWPVNEPLAVVPAMAAATEHIGFGVTVATTYEQPYHLARRLSTVDHLSRGRVGWNVVTGYLDSAARSLGRAEQPQHDERYAIAEEYIEVMYKLWESSWRDDAVVRDKTRSVYTEPERVREINHVGKYFNVPGPHICQPSPQRTPVIMQAGTSKAGKDFASKHAEAIFVAGHSPAVVAKNVADIRALAKGFGRDPQHVKFLALICPVLGDTQEEAEQKFAEYTKLGSVEGAFALFGGWTGIDLSKYGDDEELRHVESNAIRSAVEAWSQSSPNVAKWTKHTVAQHIIVGGLGATVVGSASRVADEFERWVEKADVDGFNIAYAITPGSFDDVARLLLPELRQRGLFWDDYAVNHGTYRENLYGRPGQAGLLPDHPAAGTHAIGLNPIDWKCVTYGFGVHSIPWVSGREAAGTVVQVGADVSSVAKGDRVLVTSTNYRDIRTSTFQEYVVAFPFNVCRIPEWMSFEEGVTVGVGSVAAAGAIFDVLGLSPQTATDTAECGRDADGVDSVATSALPWILIWGGSCVTGSMAVQLSKQAGLRVAAVASRHNAPYLAGLGADLVLDRHQPDEAAATARQLGIGLAIDCVGAETAGWAAQALKEGGKLVCLVRKPDLTGLHTVAPGIVIQDILVKKFHEDPAYGQQLMDYITWALQTQVIKPIRYETIRGGLAGVEEGLRRLKNEEVSGYKLVVVTDETLDVANNEIVY
ncbi:MAG: hypothetical protein M1838_005734 [Thelocarpon superellum]|nr:MAG: hypothetical protein M1838_005734 [Thelocarpon superellum]